MKADKKTVAALIAYLQELPDGTEITTCQLMEAAGFSAANLDFPEMMNIHAALFRAAKRAAIDLDMSKHDDMDEGLPYNLDFKVTHLGK
ncbi:MAG: hypothetical protein IKX58_00840 [Clostridia bacterium]|nr:hypothetical protein [Clostridia bacterium]